MPDLDAPTEIIIRKSRGGMRKAPLNEAAQAALRGWLAERAVLSERLSAESDGPLKAPQRSLLEAYQEDQHAHLWLIPANRKLGQPLGPQGGVVP